MFILLILTLIFSLPRWRAPALRWANGMRHRAAPELTGSAFKRDQLTHRKVRAAYHDKEATVRSAFAAAGVPYPNASLYFRGFKAEKMVELWAPPAPGAPYKLIKSWPICALSGKLGPKRVQGDLQVPEGYYTLDQFNPESNYLLSMRVSYPNKADRILGDKADPGGLIYIHGNCVTIGCLPMTDGGIQEIYLAALEAHAAGQKEIPFHIFPARLDAAGLAQLRRVYANDPAFLAFWDTLRPGYESFEKTHHPPRMTVAPDGRYLFSEGG